MKLPDYIEEENSYVRKYLYPIMYEDKENCVKLIYSDELNELKKDLNSNVIEILENAIDRKKIIIVDSTLTKEEQSKFIKDFIKQNEEQHNAEKDETEDINEEIEFFSKDNSINVSLVDIANYLSSEIKQKVNMAMEFEMPYLIELYINDDATRIMVVLDTIINNKTELLSGINIINDVVRNSRIMGIPLKDIASYYKNDILGPIKDIELLDGIINIEKLDEQIKSLSIVSNREVMDYTLGMIGALKQSKDSKKK